MSTKILDIFPEDILIIQNCSVVSLFLFFLKKTLEVLRHLQDQIRKLKPEIISEMVIDLIS